MAIPRKPLVDPSIGSIFNMHLMEDKGDLDISKARLDLFEQRSGNSDPVTE